MLRLSGFKRDENYKPIYTRKRWGMLHWGRLIDALISHGGRISVLGNLSGGGPKDF